MGDPSPLGTTRHHVRAPGPVLRPFVRVLWASAPEPRRHGGPLLGLRREAVLPSGTTHLVFRVAGPALRLFSEDAPRGRLFEPAVIGGPRSGAYVKDISEPAESVGAELCPGAAAILLGVPAGELAERHTSLTAVLGASVATIHERLCEARSAAERLDLLEAFLIARLRSPRAIRPVVAEAIAWFERSTQVGEAVRRSGYSHRHFVELFRTSVGLTPKLYCRVRRLQAVISRAGGERTSWAELAQDAGYSDQPHLHRDFRALAGLSPNVYRALASPGSRHVPLPGQFLPRRAALATPE